MNWYFIVLGGHTHVRVFMNGAKCGDLCFRNDEFEIIKRELLNSTKLVDFIPDNDQVRKLREEENE